MAEIKLIDKDTDLSKVLHPVPWDDIFRIKNIHLYQKIFKNKQTF